MSETGCAIGPICGGELTSDQTWSNFLWMLVLSLMLFGEVKEPTGEAKEEKKDGQQPVPAEPDE